SPRVPARTSSFWLRPMSRSPPRTSQAISTTRRASSSYAGSCARAFCASEKPRQKMARPLRSDRSAGEVDRLLRQHGFDVGAAQLFAHAKRDAPTVTPPLDLFERDGVDLRQPFGFADSSLGGLDGERVRRASAVAIQVDSAVEVLVEEGVELLIVNAPEIEAFRQDDDVGGEAIASDVSGLPDPGRVDLLLECVIERTPVLGAT